MNGRIIAFSRLRKTPGYVDQMIDEIKKKAHELERRSAALKTVKSLLCPRCETFTPHWQISNGNYVCSCGTEHSGDTIQPS